MELSEQVTALTAENKKYNDMVNNLNCEKIALDQMLVSALKEALDAKKNLLMKDIAINNLNQQIQGLLNQNSEVIADNENLKKEIESLKEAQLHIMTIETQESDCCAEGS